MDMLETIKGCRSVRKYPSSRFPEHSLRWGIAMDHTLRQNPAAKAA